VQAGPLNSVIDRYSPWRPLPVSGTAAGGWQVRRRSVALRVGFRSGNPIGRPWPRLCAPGPASWSWKVPTW